MGTIDKPIDKSIQIIASDKSWIEGTAVSQLEHVARFEGMEYSVGLPDLHPGKGTPIGAAFFSKGVIYPHLVGNDIGCGMGLWQVDLPIRKAKIEKWQKLLLEPKVWQEVMKDDELPSSPFDHKLGTVGGGNHFAEFQSVVDVVRSDLFEGLKLDRKQTFLMIHSGSRGLGDAVLREHTAVKGAEGLKEGSAEFSYYFERHDFALDWAIVRADTLEGGLPEGLRDQILSECGGLRQAAG